MGAPRSGAGRRLAAPRPDPRRSASVVAKDKLQAFSSRSLAATRRRCIRCESRVQSKKKGAVVEPRLCCDDAFMRGPQGGGGSGLGTVEARVESAKSRICMSSVQCGGIVP
eukprot:GDKH01023672.1.p2 GENE.GDKH01023672.1~~GDKH01023672.1.p2  ORF type:complete len:111 (-),score=13.76 GDKH01023672.1:68-400(-)